MKKLYVLLASAALLAGCGNRVTTPIATPGATPAVVSKVDQLERRYLALRPLTDLVIPYLPTTTVSRVELLLGAIDRAIAIARVTRSAAGAKASADDAARALDELQRFTGPAPS